MDPRVPFLSSAILLTDKRLHSFFLYKQRFFPLATIHSNFAQSLLDLLRNRYTLNGVFE